MANVGTKTNILKVSAKLKKALVNLGTPEQFAAHQALFDEDEESHGVYLVTKGKVRLCVRDYPQAGSCLLRRFALGSARDLHRLIPIVWAPQPQPQATLCTLVARLFLIS